MTAKKTAFQVSHSRLTAASLRFRTREHISTNPVAPADLTATVYLALGIDPATEVNDAVGRPWKIADGTPLRQLFG
ncbi:MAG: DUF1501 domain-containing protein [Planctomycetes bacterium]|nr:DUF1501 domain-containing protein [Planctomycetota bacterium]